MTKPQEANPDVPEKATNKRPRRRWLRRIVFAILLLVVLLIVLVIFAPTIISSNSGRSFVLGVVNGQVVGRVEADNLSLSWGGGQSLSGVVVRDVDGKEIARVGRVELPDATLLGLARGKLSLGRIEIGQVTGDIVGYDDGTTNLQRALAMRNPQPGTPKPPATKTPGPYWPKGLSFGLALRDIDIAYRAEGVDDPIRLTVSDADLSAADPTSLSLKLNAKLAQGARGGALTADAMLKQLFDASGYLQAGNAVAQVQADLSDLPIDLLDTLAAQDGKLLALLGPVLNGHILADVTTTGGTASIEAVSEHLNINSKVAFDESGVKNEGLSVIRLTLTPQAWAALTSVEGKSASVLAEPVQLAVELRKLGLPLNDAGLNLAGINVDLGLTVGDTKLTIDGVGEVTLASTTGNVSTTQLGKSVTAGFNTTSSINRKPGGVSINVELANLIDAKNQVNTSGLSASVNGKLTNAPIAAILDEMMPGTTYGLATRALGPVVDATVNLNTAPRKDGKGIAGGFDLDLLTDGGEAGLQSALIGKFDLGEEAVQAGLADGSFAKFRVTPGLIKAYQEATVVEQDTQTKAKPSDVTLGGPATFRLDLTKASVRLLAGPDGYKPDPATIQLVGQLKSPKIQLDQNGNLAATLKGLLVDIAADGPTGDTTLALNANIDYPTPAGEEPKPGSIMSRTTVHGMFDSTGQLTLDTASYETATQIRQAPIDLVDALFDMQGDLSGSVGPRALLDASGSYTPSDANGSGGIDLALKSKTASADMKLLMEGGRWTLKADAPLSFQVTPRLSQTMLKKVMPFLGSAVSARLPIGVTVKQEGFSAPVKDLGITDVAADVRLELGELDLRGEGVLKRILEQLGVGDRSLLNAKFSPVTINLSAGKLSYQGLTMGIDDIVLGFSGNVDLNTSRLDLKMTIPGSSLANISFLSGKIDPSHVIVVPLTGTFDQPTIDVKLLTGEIAKLAVKSQLQDVVGGAVGGSKTGNQAGGQAGDSIGDKVGEKVGGEAGAVVGGIINEILTGSKTTDSTDATQTQQKDTAQAPAQADTEEAADETQLTPEEREARKERRRLRRERLEREQAERESQTQ